MPQTDKRTALRFHARALPCGCWSDTMRWVTAKKT